MKRPSGFTMVEVMIVLVILGVLGAVAYPTYAGYVVKTRRIEAQAAMIDALQQEEQYYSQHNSYIPFSSSAMPREPRFKWWSGSAAASSAYELDARACPGRDIAECVQVRARPGTDKVDTRFSDAGCGTLSIDSTGQHAATGAAPRCWP